MKAHEVMKTWQYFLWWSDFVDVVLCECGRDTEQIQHFSWIFELEIHSSYCMPASDFSLFVFLCCLHFLTDFSPSLALPTSTNCEEVIILDCFPLISPVKHYRPRYVVSGKGSCLGENCADRRDRAKKLKQIWSYGLQGKLNVSSFSTCEHPKNGNTLHSLITVRTVDSLLFASNSCVFAVVFSHTNASAHIMYLFTISNRLVAGMCITLCIKYSLLKAEASVWDGEVRQLVSKWIECIVSVSRRQSHQW